MQGTVRLTERARRRGRRELALILAAFGAAIIWSLLTLDERAAAVARPGASRGEIRAVHEPLPQAPPGEVRSAQLTQGCPEAEPEEPRVSPRARPG